MKLTVVASNVTRLFVDKDASLNVEKDLNKIDSDNALMLAYARGEVDAFDSLYGRYKQPLYQFVLHGCSNPASAAEIFQDIWMAVIKARESYQDTGTFKSWLYRIARNKLIDFYRKQNQRISEEFDEQTVHEKVTTLNAPLTPMELADLHADKRRVQQAVHSLPWKQRDAVIMKYIAGFSLAEIAVEQGDPQETVKSRLRYAYTRLRQLLRSTS